MTRTMVFVATINTLRLRQTLIPHVGVYVGVQSRDTLRNFPSACSSQKVHRNNQNTELHYIEPILFIYSYFVVLWIVNARTENLTATLSFIFHNTSNDLVRCETIRNMGLYIVLLASLQSSVTFSTYLRLFVINLLPHLFIKREIIKM